MNTPRIRVLPTCLILEQRFEKMLAESGVEIEEDRPCREYNIAANTLEKV